VDAKSLPGFVNLWFRAAISSPDASAALERAKKAEPALVDVDLPSLPQLVRRTPDGMVAADLLGAVVRRYQLRDSDVWGAVVLEMLAPAIREAAADIVSKIPTDDEEELCRQLVVEFLHVAARTNTARSPRWLKLRIVRRARRRTVVWLLRDLEAADTLPLDDELAVAADRALSSEARIRWVARRLGVSPEYVRERLDEERARRREGQRRRRLDRAA